jgi:hypothetical protein
MNKRKHPTILCPICRGEDLLIEFFCCGDEACGCRYTGGYRYELADCEACRNTGRVPLEDRPAA